MRSVSAALAVFEAVADGQPIGVSALARVVELPKSTAQRMLTTLGELGWIRSSGEEPTRWSLTAKAVSIGSRHQGDQEIRRAVLPAMHWLANTTRETIHLSVPEDRHIVLIDKVEGLNPVRTNTYIGGRAPMHSVASGKAMLAAMPESTARAILEAAPLEALTPQTPTDVEALCRELVRIGKVGYAVSVRTRHPEIAAVGAAVLGMSGQPVASLSVSLPAHRLPRRVWPEIGALVFQAALESTERLAPPRSRGHRQ